MTWIFFKVNYSFK